MPPLRADHSCRRKNMPGRQTDQTVFITPSMGMKQQTARMAYPTVFDLI
ncbi:MAG: hypothetical protein ACLVEJ_24925 [Parabacteroides sp.]